ncbi:type II secretion system F family protein [Acidaminobacter sp.]|uniref:type II secretion system F family protein n=1 Tax=Acidaminobacter sp. TaxID=1872102 RepID=UPI00137E3DEF|nr:type II secretion system F family protein [Acidaminobacter sp.]MDK9709696.1 type II secretion system F family protein [Acidaminobacter sp.]MZQ96947.1 hypothetical protein [Acidaminobacter sp.]
MLKYFKLIQPVWYRVTPSVRRIRLWLILAIDTILSTWILFENPGFFVFVLLIKLPAMNYQAQMAAVQTKDEFLSDFARFLSLIASTTSTGKSLQRAFDQTVDEFSTACEPLAFELKKLSRLMQLGTPLTSGLGRLARQFDLEEATDLSRQLLHAESCGHDMTIVLKRSSVWIGGHILHKQQLIRKMTDQVLEFRLTSKMPLLVLFLLNATYADYLSLLYTTPGGRVLMMTAALALEGGTILFERTRLIQLKTKGLI